MSTLPQHAPQRIHRLVAEHLALTEAELRERVAELEHDVVVYRDLLQRALDRLRDLQGRERARERRVRHLLDENARLRSHRQAAA